MENYDGIRSAVKGKREVDGDNKVETAIETAEREIYEETVIRVISTGEVYNEYKIKKHFNLAKCTYLECYVDSEFGSNNRDRLIGLFIVPVDENILKIKLYDKMENQVSQNELYVFCFKIEFNINLLF